MKLGKLTNDLLEEVVFKHMKFRRPEVISRPGIGIDCAALDFGDYECILSTDPLTGAANEIGRLAINISCNDIATNGIEPIGIMLAVMLPETIEVCEIDEMMRQAAEEATKVGIEIIGGHTEITDAVNKPIIVSTAIGRKKKGSSLYGKSINPGDMIVMTKTAGLEGTAIIASDYKEHLLKILTEEEFDQANQLFNQVSVVKEGVIAGQTGAKLMHDITEGGVLGAIWEMCQVSGVGADVIIDNIPIASITEKICNHFRLDSLRLISSGSMLIILPEENSRLLLDKLEKEGIRANIIGRITDNNICMIKEGKRMEVAPPESDELYSVKLRL